ncbi:unnamed protein product [Prorocentrum cordatum]|uniref:F-box domain-containing protein n=1 Tax=Prorocentrum cordatum TaxID=2364126 RepID=A0ABN9V100_9DINO|nr:unnamed protein product [Polarella glacialis]
MEPGVSGEGAPRFRTRGKQGEAPRMRQAPLPAPQTLRPQRRPASLAAPAAAISFPQVALERIFQYALGVDSIAYLARVCRDWRATAREPTFWAGKKVFIEGAGGITREQLSAWLPSWRSAERVYLTCSQLDLLGAPPAVPHAIVHLWQTESFRVQNVSWRDRDVVTDEARMNISTHELGFWKLLRTGGEACLACLTADRAPDEVCLMREELGEDGVDLWAPIDVGWTSAKTFDELAEAYDISVRSDFHVGTRKTDRIVHAQMLPEHGWDIAMATLEQMGMRHTAPPAPPLFRASRRGGPRKTLCTARLDRARGEIQVTTGGNSVHTLGMRGLPLPLADEMRFFVIMWDDPRLRRMCRRHPRRKFAELAVPFLASTFRPASPA